MINNLTRVTIPIQVKTYDIDYARIVHNAVYMRWLEDLRTALVTQAYPIEDMLADNISPILVRTEIEYRLPVRFGDELAGTMWVSDLGRSRWIVEAELRVGDEIKTYARQTGIFTNLITFRPIRIPARLRQIWQP